MKKHYFLFYISCPLASFLIYGTTITAATNRDIISATGVAQATPRIPKHKQRHCQRLRCHLLRITQLANEKSICHIINDGDDLARHSRHSQRQNCLWNRHAAKQFLILFSMLRTPLFALFQAFDIALHRKMKAVIHRRRIVGEEPLLLLRHKSMDYGPK